MIPMNVMKGTDFITCNLQKSTYSFDMMVADALKIRIIDRNFEGKKKDSNFVNYFLYLFEFILFIYIKNKNHFKINKTLSFILYFFILYFFIMK